MLAGTPERVDWLRMAVARGRYLGMDLQLISAAEAKKLYPLLEEKHFLGAIYDPIEGHVDPYGVTHAYAKSAQLAGAEIVRQNRVIDTRPRADGTWDVITEKGTVHAEHVVNAGGLWAREVGRFVGLELPILAMEHQYFITEDLPELQGQQELLHVIDFEAEIYMRQERQGMLLGTYERAGVPWSPKTTPWDFGQDLLPNDLERIAPSVTVAFEHFPRLESAGIKKVVNGPFTFAPDGNPLVGPIKGLKNYWVACGVMAGFSQGGGVGLSLANWMVNGDPGADIWAMDVARYGDWANRPYTNAKVRENYSRRFRIRFPNEELEAARPLRTTPIYEKLQAENAVFGDYCTLEHPLWFAPKGTPAREDATFRRSNAHPHVAEECRAVRESCGLIEISNYGKFEITGPGAAEWLSKIMACKVPAVGRIALSPMLNDAGRLIGDFTLCRVSADRFFVVGTYAAEVFYMRWFEQHLPPTGVTVRPCAMEYLGLSVAGPRVARAAAEAGRRRPVDDVVPVHVVRGHGRRHGSGTRRSRLVHGRDGLRDVGDVGIPAHAVRPAARNRQGPWPAQFRRSGVELSAPGKELRQLGARIPAHLRAVRGGPGPFRASRQAGLHRQSRGGCREGERRRAQAHYAGGRREGRRCDRRRADLARRQGRRLGHLGWLWPHRGQVDCARLRRQRGGGGDAWFRRRIDG